VVVGAGFIGTEVARRLVGDGVDTTVLHRSPLAAGRAAMFVDSRCIQGSAADRDVVVGALDGASHVIWCAGGLLPAEADGDPAGSMDATYRPLATTLEVMRERGNLDLTYISSGGAVYGNPPSLPVCEASPAEPRTAYGIACRSAELLVDRYREVFGVPSVVLRCGNVYGPGQPGNRSQGLVAAILHACRNGNVLPVFGDGGVVRDYVYIDDVVAVMRELVGRRDASPTFNVGSGIGTSVSEVIETAKRVTGIRVRTQYVAGRPGDVASVVLDIAKLRSLVALSFVSLDDGMRRTWDQFASPALSPSAA